MKSAEPLADRVLEMTVDAAQTFTTILGDLLVTLVRKDALSSGDVRMIVLSSGTIIRHSEPESLSRMIHKQLCEHLERKLSWPAAGCELDYEPLPPDPEEGQTTPR